MYLLILSFIADLIFGDPEWFKFHPVRIIGKLIKVLDNLLRRKSSKVKERIKGTILVIFVIGIASLGTYLIIIFSYKINSYLGFFITVFLAYTTISVKDLQIKSKDILKELQKNSIDSARKALSKIVGRDTENLTEERIIIATVESIAENTNDGIVAPLFYLTLGGPVLAIIYKTINTLDSMLGYKNEKYIHFGWASAKLDDIFNFIPARICGILISLSAGILRYGFFNSFKIMLKYYRNHPSPNSGVPESAMAGALKIRLGGSSFYNGCEVIKPYIGENKVKISNLIINNALSISFTTSVLMLLLGVFYRWII